MKLVRWMRFTWDLTKLPEAPASPGAAHQIRPVLREEVATARHVILSSLALDSSWNDILKTMQAPLEARLDSIFDAKEPHCLVITHGTRIIGASAYDIVPEADNHLVSGPCISNEYRNRGLGVALLHGTLTTLKEAGITTAHGLTRVNVAASRFVYPKFGSTSAPFEFEPQLATA